jgi:hypothetical protein
MVTLFALYLTAFYIECGDQKGKAGGGGGTQTASRTEAVYL